MTHYKCLSTGRVTPYVHVTWPVRARQWTEPATPKLCQSGWHLATEIGLSLHLVVGELWTAEGRGACACTWDKISFEQARLCTRVGTVTPSKLRHLMLDFAEHVLWAWERAYPCDGRPRRAIEAARGYMEVDGDATDRRALVLAAADAAYAAAYAAGYTAGAYAAAVAIGYATTYAAGGDFENVAAASYAAAVAAATVPFSTAYTAAQAEERAWQCSRIIEVVGAR